MGVYMKNIGLGILSPELTLREPLDQQNLQDLTKKTEKYIDRKVKTLMLTADEFKKLASNLNQRSQLIYGKREPDV